MAKRPAPKSAPRSAPRAAPRNKGRSPAAAMLTVRKVHSYLGVFIAPSVLFFALTGAVQLFSLHEAHGDYKPVPLLETLGRVHKDARLANPPRPGAAPSLKAAADDDHADGDHDHDHADADHDHDHADAAPVPSEGAKAAKRDKTKGMAANVLALKWVFLVVALGLAVSTLLGVWMALVFNRSKALTWGCLLAGAVVPLALLIL